MISHFPQFYKDELFYSVLARYHQRSGYESSKETLRDLFGKSTNTAISNFTGDLSVLCKRIGSDNYNPTDIIRNHTLLPYFMPFISKEHGYKLINQMISGQNSVSVALGLAASTVKDTNNFRFCSKCFEEETAVYGEAYWHRTHQLPGVLICQNHKEILFESNIPYRNKVNKHNLIPLDEQAIKYRKEILFPGSYLEHLVFISEQSFRLLNDWNLLIDINILREFYISKLYGRRYITTSNRLRLKELVPDFLNAFGTGFLNYLDSSFGEHATDSWFIKLLRKQRVSCHPLRHLLMLKFIGEVMPNNTIYNTGIHPFGVSPWPCLNKVCDNYKKLTIYFCDVTTDSKTRKPVGTFKCHSCNYTYSRKGPDLVEQDKYKIGRVKNFGEVWMNKLYELNTAGKHSIRGMALYLNVDSKTVKKYLVTKSTVKPKINLSEHNNMRDKTMKTFLALRENKPDLSRTELRSEAPNLYMWLYRNENDWLLNNLPLPKRSEKAKKRINWIDRDQEYSILIIREAVNILIEIPLIRVTKTIIAKRLDLLAKFENYINKLPISQIILEEVTETNEEFQIRRIRYFVAKFKVDNVPFSKYGLARAAGIKGEFIQGKVDFVLQEEVNFFN